MSTTDKVDAAPDIELAEGPKHQVEHDGFTPDTLPTTDSSRPVQIDTAKEKIVRRKLDRVVVPLVFALYMVSFLDRSNIGNAETAGMSEDLGFDDAHYQVNSGYGSWFV
jgi:hypothetical protein